MAKDGVPATFLELQAAADIWAETANGNFPTLMYRSRFLSDCVMAGWELQWEARRDERVASNEWKEAFNSNLDMDGWQEILLVDQCWIWFPSEAGSILNIYPHLVFYICWRALHRLICFSGSHRHLQSFCFWHGFCVKPFKHRRNWMMRQVLELNQEPGKKTKSHNTYQTPPALA